MKLTWFGTASIAVESEGTKILFDPFVTLKGAEFPNKIEDFDGYDTIVVTHGHIDHISSIPAIVKRNPKAKIYGTKTPCATLRKKGVPEENLCEIQYGDSLGFGDIHVKAYHGKHAVLQKATPATVLSILKAGHLGNLPGIAWECMHCPENDETVFYLVEAEEKTIAVMGSLNLRDEVVYPQEMDVLILPYNGWDDNFPPAVQAIECLRPKQIYMDHFDCAFPPLTRPLYLNPILEKYPGKIRKFETEKIWEI